MGFLSDQKGIINRYLRETDNWNTHLMSTKDFIEKHCPVEKPTHSKVAVLGSGWLLDVPLQYLSANFDEVHLIDIHHPRAVKIKARHFQNVRFIKADITGGSIEKVYNCVKNYRKNKSRNHYQSLTQNQIDLSSYRYVISLNLLNQLDILIIDYLKKFTIYSGEELKLLRKEIQQNHLDALPKNKSCLITDVEELYYTVSDELLAKERLIYAQLPKEKLKKTWIWKFDSGMTYYPDKKTYFNVHAFFI